MEVENDALEDEWLVSNGAFFYSHECFKKAYTTPKLKFNYIPEKLTNVP